MEIIDIQEIKQETSTKFEITLANDEGWEIAKIILDRNSMWQIAKYCQEELSYGSQLKKAPGISRPHQYPSA